MRSELWERRRKYYPDLTFIKLNQGEVPRTPLKLGYRGLSLVPEIQFILDPKYFKSIVDTLWTIEQEFYDKMSGGRGTITYRDSFWTSKGSYYVATLSYAMVYKDGHYDQMVTSTIYESKR